MPDHIFVGREVELAQLQHFLDQANAGHAQIVFVAGEAGAGKTALVNEFVHRAEDANPNLVAAVGECNAQTGAGDAYLPFREVLTTLSGADDEKQTANTVNATNTARLKEFVRVSGKTLLDVGPDLVGIFVPGASLVVKLATKAAVHSRLADKLAEQLGKPDKPDDRAAINPALDQEKIFEQYTNVLQALTKDRPLILILDDLQWADSASLNLLFHLARQLKESRVLLVGTFRPDDVALGRPSTSSGQIERHPLEPILNELKRYYGDIVIDLGEARAKEGRAFVDALIDSEPNRLDETFRAELFARTDGHALFTVELLRNLQERGDLVKDGEGRWTQKPELDWNALPARVEGVIEERLARLAETLREELTVACVMGVDFIAQVIARVQNVQERELVKDLARELDKRYRLVMEQGETKVGKQFLSQYRFTHALFQQFLYNELRASERRILHGDVAKALEELYAGYSDEIAVQLARHFQEAGDDEKALAYLIRAGDAAFRLYAQTEAVAYYTRAIELSSRTEISSEQLTQLYTRRGRALELSNQYEHALENYEEMLAAARERGDRQMELSAMLAMGTLHSVFDGIPDATKGEQFSNAALELAQELGDRAAQARALWNLMLVNMYLKSNPQPAIAYGEKTLAIASELNLREQMAYATTDLGMAYYLNGQLDEAEDRIEAGGALWRELGNLPMLNFTLNFSIAVFLLRGKYDKLLRVGGESLQISAPTHSGWHQGTVLTNQSFVWLDFGETARALESLERSIPLLDQKNRNSFVILARALRFWLYQIMGAFETAKDLYRTERTPNQVVPLSPYQHWTWALYALYETASGQLETAETTLQNCNLDLKTPGSTWVYLAKSQLAFARADYPQAIALADQILPHMRQFELNQFLADVLFVRGKALWMLGESAEAKESFAHARAAADALGSRRMLWQILAALAELEDDAAQADALRSQAREIVTYIVEHSPPELREGFLNLPQARAIMH